MVGHTPPTATSGAGTTANLRSKILDFRGSDSSGILILKGWNSHAHRELPGNDIESTNLSRDLILVGRLGAGPGGRCRPQPFFRILNHITFQVFKGTLSIIHYIDYVSLFNFT